MFLGRFEHNIDDKSRVIIPAKYRELIKSGAYITQGFDRNLMVLTTEVFERVVAYLNELGMTDPDARTLKRLIFSSASPVVFDKLGRFLIPAYLREFARIENQVVVVGVGDYFEIWAQEEWRKQESSLQNAEVNEHRFAAFEIHTR